MHPSQRNVQTLVVALVLAVCYCLLVSTRIELAVADVGRHIENGRLLLQGQTALLYRNFYSYLFPDFPFINHHWGIGVLFWLVHQWAGFEGLSVLNVAMLVGTFAIAFALAVRQSNLVVATIVAVVLMPLLTLRREIRPESLTYLFCFAFYGLLSLHTANRLRARWLALLIPIQCVWVNCHIGFFFGELLVAGFLLQACVDRTRRSATVIRPLVLVLVGIIAVTLANPNFIRGALYPLFIFNNYGFAVWENQSPFRLMRLGIHDVSYDVFIATLGLIGAATAVRLFKGRPVLTQVLDPLLLITLAMAGLAISGVRHLALFGFFALPFLASSVAIAWNRPLSLRSQRLIVVPVLLVLGGFTVSTVQERGPAAGLGLMPGVEGSGEFFVRQKLHGPVFNNFEIGSYVEYFAKGSTQVFVDNRPEAYPASFWTGDYVAFRKDEAAWAAAAAQYRLDVIWLFRNERRYDADRFILRRFHDPGWALVYLDDVAVIYVRRTPEHAALIRRFEIRDVNRLELDEKALNAGPDKT